MMTDKLREAAQAVRDAKEILFLREMSVHDKVYMLLEDAINALEAALAEPEQEPVAWYDKHGMVTHDPFEGITPLYTAPPRKEWVGLTDREFQPMIQKAMAYYGYDQSKPSHLTVGAGFRVFANAIESRLKDKNS